MAMSSKSWYSFSVTFSMRNEARKVPFTSMAKTSKSWPLSLWVYSTPSCLRLATSPAGNGAAT
eukprot:7090419-Pyramimonas_sp.AAC.2